MQSIVKREKCMRILVVSDIHGNRTRTRNLYNLYRRNKFDIVLINGDITQFQGLDAAEEILSILSRLGRKAYFVPGNCDPPKLLKTRELAGAINIHGKIEELDLDFRKIYIVGLGGSTTTPFHTWIEFEEEEYKKILPEPKKPFIFMAHNPPYNTKIDKTWRRVNAGSKVIRGYIEKYEPILGIHGHIHEAYGEDRIGNTIIFNPGPLQAGHYAIVEVDEEISLKIKLSKI